MANSIPKKQTDRIFLRHSTFAAWKARKNRAPRTRQAPATGVLVLSAMTKGPGSEKTCPQRGRICPQRGREARLSELRAGVGTINRDLDDANASKPFSTRVRASETAGRHEVARADRGTLPMATAESFTGISHQQVSRWAKSLNDRDAYRAKLYGRAYSAAMAVAANQGARELLSQSDQNDWRTPGKYLDAARDGGKP